MLKMPEGDISQLPVSVIEYSGQPDEFEMDGAETTEKSTVANLFNPHQRDILAKLIGKVQAKPVRFEIRTDYDHYEVPIAGTGERMSVGVDCFDQKKRRYSLVAKSSVFENDIMRWKKPAGWVDITDLLPRTKQPSQDEWSCLLTNAESSEEKKLAIDYLIKRHTPGYPDNQKDFSVCTLKPDSPLYLVLSNQLEQLKQNNSEIEWLIDRNITARR